MLTSRVKRVRWSSALRGSSGQIPDRLTQSGRLERTTAQNRPQERPAPTGWERSFWLVFNRSSVAIRLFNNHRVGIDANQAACDYMKRPRAELVERKIDLNVVPPALEAFKLAWERLLRFGDWIGAVDLVRSDGVVLQTEFVGASDADHARRAVRTLARPNPPIGCQATAARSCNDASGVP